MTGTATAAAADAERQALGQLLGRLELLLEGAWADPERLGYVRGLLGEAARALAGWHPPSLTLAERLGLLDTRAAELLAARLACGDHRTAEDAELGDQVLVEAAGEADERTRAAVVAARLHAADRRGAGGTGLGRVG